VFFRNPTTPYTGGCIRKSAVKNPSQEFFLEAHKDVEEAKNPVWWEDFNI